MATPKAPIFQPNMGGTATPTYVRPGVVDQSSGVMANTVANLIPGAIEGYENYKVGKWIKDEVNPLITQVENTMQDKERNVELGYDAEVIESNWNDMMGSDQSIEQYQARMDPVFKKYDENFARLKAAEEQGKISPEEFQVRYTKSLREAVNRNPWLEQKLYAKSQQHLQAMGVLDEMSSYERNLKDQKDAAASTRKTLESQSYQLSLPVTPEMTNEQLTAQINTRNEVILRNRKLNEMIEYNTALPEAFYSDPANFSKASETLTYRGNEIIGGAEKQLAEASGNPTATAAVLAATKKQVADEIARIEKLTLQSPTGTKLAASHKQNLETQLAALSDLSLGVDRTKHVQNLQATNQALNDLKIQEAFPNLPVLKAIGPFATTLGFDVQNLAKTDPKAAEGLLRGLGTMLDYGSQVNPMSAVATGSRGGNASIEAESRMNMPETQAFVNSGTASDAFTRMADSTRMFQTAETRSQVSQFTSGMTAAVMAPTADPVESVRTANIALHKIITQPDFKLMAGDPQFTRDVTRLIDKSVTSTKTDMMKVIADETAANPGFAVEFDVMPNGSFEVRANTPGATKQLQDKFSNQVNNALDAYALSQGMSKAQVAPTFYKAYFGDLVANDPDLGAAPATPIQGNMSESVEGGLGDVQTPTSSGPLDVVGSLVDIPATQPIKRVAEGKPSKSNPLNIKVPGKETFQHFATPEEGVLAASRQLERYALGKTTGKKLETLEGILGVWNNEKEKGSASNEDYLETVVQHSGLKPGVKLDMTNPKTVAALIYGQSIAEGNRQDPNKVYALVKKDMEGRANATRAIQRAEAGKAKTKQALGATAAVLDQYVNVPVGYAFNELLGKPAEAAQTFAQEAIDAEADYRRRLKSGKKSTPAPKDTNVVPEVFR